MDRKSGMQWMDRPVGQKRYVTAGRKQFNRLSIVVIIIVTKASALCNTKVRHRVIWANQNNTRYCITKSTVTYMFNVLRLLRDFPNLIYNRFKSVKSFIQTGVRRTGETPVGIFLFPKDWNLFASMRAGMLLFTCGEIVKTGWLSSWYSGFGGKAGPVERKKILFVPTI